MRAAASTQMKLHYWPGPGGMQEYIRDQARVKSIVPGEVRSPLFPISLLGQHPRTGLLRLSRELLSSSC